MRIFISNNIAVYKPGISVFEAKCYLYFENDKKPEAKELYHSATILAEQFDDKVLKMKDYLNFHNLRKFIIFNYLCQND